MTVDLNVLVFRRGKQLSLFSKQNVLQFSCVVIYSVALVKIKTAKVEVVREDRALRRAQDDLQRTHLYFL